MARAGTIAGDERADVPLVSPPRPDRVLRRWVPRLERRRSRRRAPVRLKVGLAVIVVLGLAAFVVPPLFNLNPYAMNTNAILQKPTWQYLFGTDDYGRSVFARVLYGIRTSFEIGLCTTALTGAIGLFVSTVLLRVRGLRAVAARVLDALMALPAVVVAMAIVTIIGPGFKDVVVVETLFFMPWSVRMMRASMLKVESITYVEAAISQGATTARVIRRHILPNAAAPILVYQTLIFAYSVLAEAVLSFLGVGIASPTASLGNILAEAQPVMLQNPLFSVFPGVTIALLVLSVNVLADGIAEHLKVDRTTGIQAAEGAGE